MDFKKSTLRRQRGLQVCNKCFDKPQEIAPLDMKKNSYRVNGTSITAENSPTTFTFGTGGITAISQSQNPSRYGSTRVFFMRVASTGGAVDITANPQIVVGTNGDRLTLQGTSSSATLKLDTGTGLRLNGGSIILSTDVSINLVYSSGSAAWVETSRS
jgi:hypothetical protein